MQTDIAAIIAENRRRNTELAAKAVYNPVRGIGCIGERVEVATPVADLPRALIPVTMANDPEMDTCRCNAVAWEKLRCRHDFEYWCVRCVHIRDKQTGAEVPFRLNVPQRRVAGILEEDRLAGRPLRLIMLKARQWGGSTLVQMYMAWIQSVHRRNWHSLICAHVKDTSAGIRGMYTKVLDTYPSELWEGEAPPAFRPYERTQNIREITGRGCRVTISSAENQDSIRGSDFAMAHLSETAFWPATPKHTPEDLVRAVCGAITYEPYTLIAMESTANGVGNFFHREWLRAENHESDYHAVFVPWHEIEIYRLPVADSDVPELWNSLTDYERALWAEGRTLEQIAWYHRKAREHSTADKMQAEYPGTATEAFASTGCGVFAREHAEKLRAGCRPPVFVGEMGTAGLPVADSRGRLHIWEHPDADADYVVAVDIGGRWEGADFSVIAVLTADARPRVVAQWRGHIDHDLLADSAMSMAAYYNEALLVVESNTLESEASATPDNSLTVLERLAAEYGNVYTRQVTDRLTQAVSDRVGFHTNRRTKPLLVSTLIAAVREGGYIERCNDAVDELLTYEQLPNGSFAARVGCHDDMLMTRALALYVIAAQAPAAPPSMAPAARW